MFSDVVIEYAIAWKDLTMSNDGQMHRLGLTRQQALRWMESSCHRETYKIVYRFNYQWYDLEDESSL